MAPKKTSKSSAKKSSSAKLVKMERGEKTADVHPDEVENWKKAGWREAK